MRRAGETEPMTAGEYLRVHIRARGLTINELCARTNVTRSHMSAVINNHCRAGMELTLKLSSVLGMDAEEFAVMQVKRQLYEFQRQQALSTPDDKSGGKPHASQPQKSVRDAPARHKIQRLKN